MRPQALYNDCRGWIFRRHGANVGVQGVGQYPRRRRTRGQALVEFAFIAPVFFLLVLGVIDLGRVFYTYEALTNAAREGARYCALHAHDSALVVGSASDATQYRVTQELDGTVGNLTFSSPVCDTSIIAGNPVTVTVSTTFTPITPLISSLLPGGSLTILGTATMMMTK